MPSAVASAVASKIFFATAIKAKTAMFIAKALTTVISVAVTSVASSIVTSVFSAKPKIPAFGTDAQVARTRERTLSVRQPIASHRVIYGETRVGGVVTFLHSTDDNERLNQLITIAGHEVNSIGQLYLDDIAVTVSSNNITDTKYKDLVDVYTGVGTTSGDSALQTALETNASTKWTSNHKQTGRAKIYTRFKYDQDVFGGSLPNVTAVVQGRKVYDPRDASTAYSNNSALCIRDYLTNSTFGLGEPTARINDTNFNAQANICDENVTLSAGGTEKRYTCNGTFHADQTPKEVLQALLSSCAGKLTYQGGQWNLYVGAYATPTITLDEDDLDGGMQITTQVTRRELFNGARGVYVDPNNLYQPTDFPVVTNLTYLSQDQSESIYKDFDFQFTTSSATAQRLAKIELEKVRQQITVLMPVSLKNGLRLQAGDNVSVTNTRMGWTSKVFTVEEWSFAQRGDNDSPRLGVDLVLRETASAVYDWISSEETEVDPAPDTDLPDPFTVASPTNLIVTETLFSTRDGGGVKARASLAWTASVDSFVQEYQAEYKLTTDSTYLIAGRGHGSVTTIDINDIAPGKYDLRVKAINSLGVSSTYASTTKEIAGLLAQPTALSGITLSSLGGLAILRWEQSVDLDVRIGGKIRIRHSKETSGAEWNKSVTIGNAISGSETVAVLPLKAGTYLLKAEDSSGIQSTMVSVLTKQATAITFTNLSTLTENSAFSGTHSDTLLDTARTPDSLKLNFGGNLDTWGNIDGVEDFDREGGVKSSGIYTFASSFDFGSVVNKRLTSELGVSIENVLDTIDEQTAQIDTWESFDGADVTGKADAQVWTRHTDNDPAGSPTWTDWQRLDSAEFSARAFQFQCRLSSDDPAYQIFVDTLKVTSDQVS